jgi:hypothetical protein
VRVLERWARRHLNPYQFGGNIVAPRHAGTGVVGNLIVLVIVLAAASAVGFGARLRNGRFRKRRSVRAGSGRGSDAAGSVLTKANLGASAALGRE